MGLRKQSVDVGSYATVVGPSFPDFAEDGIIVCRRLLPVYISSVRRRFAELDLVRLACIHVVHG